MINLFNTIAKSKGADSDIGWNFPSNNNGELKGLQDAGTETFKGSIFSSLAREICQNSLDARLDPSRPVRVEFVASQVKTADIPGLEGLILRPSRPPKPRPHLKARLHLRLRPAVL